MTETVRCEVHAKTLVITVDRPEARNALNNDVVEGLLGAFERLNHDPELAVGVVTGAGSGFCAGMDLKAFAVEGLPKRLHVVYQNGAVKPLVAAVEGFAMGGGLELALTCDLQVIAKGARLSIPEAKVGLFAAGGGVVRLARRIPYSIAMEMALTGDPITAEQAHEYGLANVLAEPGQALAAALELADRVAANAPLSVAASKTLVREGIQMSEAEFWEYQRPMVRQVMKSNDAKEGPKAFSQKRLPQWSGS